MKKRVLASLLALIIAISLLPAPAMAAGETNTEALAGDVTAAITLTGGTSEADMVTFKLSKDITVSEKITVEGYATIDGSGYTMSATTDNAVAPMIQCADGSVVHIKNITIDGNRSIDDETATTPVRALVVSAGGTCHMYDGVTIENCGYCSCGSGLSVSGTFHMHGGVIQNNFTKGDDAGASAYVQVSGIFNMYGGTIQGGKLEESLNNGTENPHAGGILVTNDSTFNMTGGTITNNENAGISVHSNATLNMSGGEITANEEGISVFQTTAKICFSGTPSVTGNGDGDVFLKPTSGTPDASQMVLVTGALGTNAAIGYDANPGFETHPYLAAGTPDYAITASDMSKFIFQGTFEPDFYPYIDSENNIISGCSLKLNGGAFASDATSTADALAAPVKDGFVFDGWYTQDGTTSNEWGEKVTAPEAGKTYYAKWADPTKVIASGDCGAEGENVRWKLTEDGTLTLTGSGAMADYETDGTPWTAYRASITKIVLPDGLTHIGKSAFLRTKVTDVTIPNTVTSIAQNAFWNCNTIHAYVPASVTEIGETAFFGTFKITIDDKNPNFTAENNVIYNKDKTVLIQCSQGNEGEFTIPDTVTEIAPYALHGCSKLTGTLVIPENCTAIRQSAFCQTGFTGVQFGSQVTEIESSAFDHSQLKGTLVLPSSLKIIGGNAFSSCFKITEVSIPESVETIGYAAFSYLRDAEKVTVPLADISYGKSEKGKYYIFSSYDPDGDDAVKSSSLKTVVLGATPEGVPSNELFSSSTDILEVLVLGTGVSNTGSWAIPKLTSGLYPSSLELGAENNVLKEKATMYTVADVSSMTYGDTEPMLTFDTPSDQICSDITYKSSDPEVITVDGSGNMTAVNCGEATISALYDDTVFAKLDVTVGAKKVAITWPETTPVDYNGEPHSLAVSTDLPSDLKPVYSYKVSTAGDDTYTNVAPTAPGTYTVKVESGNPNYTLTGTTTATLTISEPSKTDVSDSVTVKEPASLVYNGTEKAYTAAYEGITDWTYTYYDADGKELEAAPVNAGDYTVTIAGSNDNNYAVKTAEFTIEKAPLTITAENKSIRVGDKLPEYTYTVSGLVGNDKLISEPTVACAGADANTAGTYDITASGADAGDNYTITYADGKLTVSRKSSGGGSSGGSSGSGSTTTTTEKNPDGSTTTTVTDKKTGTVTETTKNPDGSTTVVETKKDGAVTETTKTPDGVTGTVVTDKRGEVTSVEAAVSSAAARKAAKTGEAVTLPVEVSAAENTDDAPEIDITVPKSADSVKVEIPVEDVTPGTVAVIVDKDGNEKIVAASVVTEDGIALTVSGSETVKVIDNSKTFIDVPVSNTFYDEITSMSAREIMVGKTENFFDLYAGVTLNQIANVSGRIAGAVSVDDYQGGIAWAAENGLPVGNVQATRGDVLKALYVAAGSPAVEDSGALNGFKDAASVSADMLYVAAWGVQNGVMKGTADGYLNLGVSVTRGQAAAMAGRALNILA